MTSQISSREDVEEILRGLEERLAEPVQFLVIGGAAMRQRISEQFMSRCSQAAAYFISLWTERRAKWI